MANQSKSNRALGLVPFGHCTLCDRAALRRLCQTLGLIKTVGFAKKVGEFKMCLHLLKLVLLASLVSISTAAISVELPSDPFASERLLATQIKVATGHELSQRFIAQVGREYFPGKATPSGTYTDAEVKAILSEFDRIVESMSKPIAEATATQHEKVRQTVGREVWPDRSRLSARIVDWYRLNQEFLNEAETLGVLATVLWVVAPDKIVFPASSHPEYERIFGSLLGGQRYLIQIMLNSEQITPLLPARFNVAKLRQQELEIRSAWQKISLEINFPDGQLVRTNIALRDWVIPAIRPYLKDQVLPDMEKLAARARCLAGKDKQQCR